MFHFVTEEKRTRALGHARAHMRGGGGTDSETGADSRTPRERDEWRGENNDADDVPTR